MGRTFATIMVICSVAATAVPRALHARWQTITPQSLLDGAHGVSGMLEDNSHRFWFLTDAGSVVSDGVHFTRFPANIVPAARAIAEDSRHYIWIGCPQGLVRCSPDLDSVETITTATSSGGLLSNDVRGVFASSDGSVWAATPAGISRLRGSGVWTTYPGMALPFGSSLYVFFNVEDRRGRIWLSAPLGGQRFFDLVSDTWSDACPSWCQAPGPFRDANAYPFSRSREGTLWAYRCNDLNWDILEIDDLADTLIREMTVANCTEAGGATLIDHVDRAWVRTEVGRPNPLFNVISPDYNFLLQPPGVASLDVLVDPYLLDASNALWWGNGGSALTGFSAGLMRFQGDAWGTIASTGSSERLFAHSNGGLFVEVGPSSVLRLPERVTLPLEFPLAEGSDGRIWFTRADTILTYDPVSSRMSVIAVTPSCRITADSDRNIWRASPTAISRLESGRFRVIHPPPLPLAPGFFAVSGGFLYVGYTVYTGPSESHVATFSWSGAQWDSIASTYPMAVAGDGTAWFGPASTLPWRSFKDGLWSSYPGGPQGNAAVVDSAGTLWVASGSDGCLATFGGLARLREGSWRIYDQQDGYPGGCPIDITISDRDDALVLSYGQGNLVVCQPDRMAPRAAFNATLPPKIGVARPTIGLAPAFQDDDGVEYQVLANDESQGPFTSVNVWTPENPLRQGVNWIYARARDRNQNVQTAPTVWQVVVDTLPPSPTLDEPSFRQRVVGDLIVRGSVFDSIFAGSTVDLRQRGQSAWFRVGRSSSLPSTDTLLVWDTTQLADGLYDLRLSVADSLGLTGSIQTTVVVDNQTPPDSLTAPVGISASLGGDVFTTAGDVHLYFPPFAFKDLTQVGIDTLAIDVAGAPQQPGDGTVLSIHSVSFAGSALLKPGTLRLRMPEAWDRSRSWTVARWRGGVWQPLGGTVEVRDGYIALALPDSGTYALLADLGQSESPSIASDLRVTPRVFALGKASGRAAISFSVTTSGYADVAIYDRNGRRVRRILDHASVVAGENLVEWDGRDSDGRLVRDGLYLVYVKGPGREQSVPFLVTR